MHRKNFIKDSGYIRFIYIICNFTRLAGTFIIIKLRNCNWQNGFYKSVLTDYRFELVKGNHNFIVKTRYEFFSYFLHNFRCSTVREIVEKAGETGYNIVLSFRKVSIRFSSYSNDVKLTIFMI